MDQEAEGVHRHTHLHQDEDEDGGEMRMQRVGESGRGQLGQKMTTRVKGKDEKQSAMSKEGKEM